MAVVNNPCLPDDGCYQHCDCLLDSVVPRMERLVPGALDISIREELVEALRQFCMDSEIWRFVFELVQVHAGEQTYQIPEQDESQVVRVVRVFEVDGLDSRKERIIPERKDVDHTIDCQFWYESEPGLFILNHAPERAQALRCNVVLRPAEKSSRFPVALWGQWRKAVEYRALSELHLRPGMPFSDLERANYYGQLYQQEVQKAKRVHLHNLKAHRPAYRNDAASIL